ncbi:hypothetical protein BGW42_004934 [Actinomortierella wolfii]|nr:hypothetical protein BGW42_004934 [Actinomortierella wolfii]
MKEDLLCSDSLTPQALPLFRLRLLKLEIPCNDPTLVKLLERCPALEQLSLSPLSTQVLTSMCQLLADHRLSCLTSLTLRRFEQMETQVAILKAIPSHQLRELALFPVVDAPDIDNHDSESHEDGGNGDDDVVRVLISRQHQSLEHLYLVLKDTRPSTLRDIFLTCGHLKRLNLKMQHAVDIRHLIDQPWAFTELEELTMKVAQDRRRPNSSGSSNRQVSTMSIDIAAIEQELGEDAMTQSTTPSRKEWERVEAIFMRRLGTLTRLQVLDLKGSRQAGSNITFSLANGLGHLATLEQLQEMVISDRGRHQDIAELQFMKEHWPRLKKLTFYATRPTDRWLKLRWPQLKVSETANGGHGGDGKDGSTRHQGEDSLLTNSRHQQQLQQFLQSFMAFLYSGNEPRNGAVKDIIGCLQKLRLLPTAGKESWLESRITMANICTSDSLFGLPPHNLPPELLRHWKEGYEALCDKA